jgi:hypothetical protein
VSTPRHKLEAEVNAAEWLQVMDAAAIEGLSVSDYLRRRAGIGTQAEACQMRARRHGASGSHLRLVSADESSPEAAA